MKHLARIDITKQSMTIYDVYDIPKFTCDVNTALNGPGCQQNSGCTPIGRHYVRAAIGENYDPYAVLKGRRWTGEIWSDVLAQREPTRDWILGRILWLSGCDRGVNRGGLVDTFRRYIYIHGSPESGVMKTPQSHGCIRVKPDDMLQVFDYLGYGDQVEIFI